MTTKVALHLSFMTDQNKKVNLSIPSPKQPIDPAAVDNALQTIVNKNVFVFPQGRIVSALPAQQIQTDTTTIS
ncbi:DUF2922 domain-containing protein [Alicyclobacillus dauci]|uniref:DUF2922 domain-containing protein n=1 Tax=Alicyclobacillus dauci TaxID=1475485 RepID=A0ABY6Z244_9BACL|nr:DUF2922 domain-containing protein [Alicyclobacillus dauci]WAH36673.1 DUF2922 domain-containing protein [Alicyclobacillus dauci]